MTVLILALTTAFKNPTHICKMCRKSDNSLQLVYLLKNSVIEAARNVEIQKCNANIINSQCLFSCGLMYERGPIHYPLTTLF